ncbi:YycH family regulatory protein [Oceanobacillus sp. J11TS1]|uniref:YycH family regulatory protein n=1 Tax=Oceanobacillus sp. J11TS1 TaxID=2807191 RepID=UPI001B138FFA|nr:two-component system activity regulator YycH [Oceanobacillus sp. J11TS1]GIO23948.1 hypothetical protein J11TS1_25290 [Oceanobacillus sp. J11TS1]
MKLETAKSLLLIVLIGTSLILTFGMWNYRAEYEPLNNEGSIDQVDLGGEQKDVSDVVMPNDIIFKMNGQYFGHVDPMDKVQFFGEMQQWEITGIQNSNIAEEKESDAEVEVIFPTEIPLSLFGDILNMDDSFAHSANFYVDRFYIDLQEDNQLLRIRFVERGGENVVEGVIRSVTNYDALLSIFNDLTDDKYEEMKLLTDTARNIYIPVKPKTMTSYTYTFDTMDAVKIRNIMFSNPNLVSVSESAPGSIMYRTDNRQLNISGHGMRFINVAEPNNEPTEISILQRSLDNINEYSGFTDDYRLDSFSEESIAYRLYHFQYPVVNNSYMDLSTIYQEWHNDQLSEYNRSLISLRMIINTSTKKLRNSDEIIASIQRNENQSDIRDVQIGYRLTIESDDNGEDYILLEPNWYQRINNSWSTVPDQNADTQSLEGGS